MTKKIIIYLLLLFVINITYSQNEKAKVTNVEVTRVNETIEITYKLNRKASIEIFMTDNGGYTYKKITKVRGDVGDLVFPGNKKIIYDVLEEYEEFIVDNVQFKVVGLPINNNGIEKVKQLNSNLNGHYLSWGSSMLSSGYYGIGGISYEYRYHILGVNVSVGYSGFSKIFDGKDQIHITNIDDFTTETIHYKSNGVNANIGFKLYLANKIPVVRNLYFNFLPFCCLGTKSTNTLTETPGDDGSFERISKSKNSPLFGAGLFFGYAPLWCVNNKMLFGLNMGIGSKISYSGNRFLPLNWDFGFIVKF
ncbi:MAG: hypothetical protein FWH59_01680 [Lentimicrobiaceae bacterium]|nr:hypothetical protein [Lentimicrobiaceae bacterium]